MDNVKEGARAKCRRCGATLEYAGGRWYVRGVFESAVCAHPDLEVFEDTWIATTNSKTFYDRPDYKPKGMWKCRACGEVQHGSTLFLSPYHAHTWTCSNLMCGGTCDKVESG